MNRDHKMLRDVEAFANAAAHQGIDVSPLHTASAFHAEADRLGTIPGAPWFVAKSRPRKARALEAVKTVSLWLMLVLALFIIISALFASAAKADGAVDAWEAEYGPAACDFLDDNSTLAGLSGVIYGAEHLGLTPEQAGEAVAASVLDICPEYRPLLADFVRRYGPVTA